MDYILFKEMDYIPFKGMDYIPFKGMDYILLKEWISSCIGMQYIPLHTLEVCNTYQNMNKLHT